MFNNPIVLSSSTGCDSAAFPHLGQVFINYMNADSRDTAVVELPWNASSGTEPE